MVYLGQPKLGGYLNVDLQPEEPATAANTVPYDSSLAYDTAVIVDANDIQSSSPVDNRIEIGRDESERLV